ncbi:3-deoxy-D-manno-octulosonic acid kinase [Rodentibacter trehalosifermentans]|uniref:3-deoxy-D-manno-octulosonic acid kinase n=1 Tax=Rodentibacter trehalosifermentans TaxID=1908263 RepID=A0A1V3J895_9PAST|nr:3-deoxy-D-manno-octulosonic acid kinase [Rodentibacter trehalosifermentans]OOF51448.1 3-deoxy-D-manno-octulosonic acid kinase [Rodentibacter trehalosifermentans]
MLEFQQDNQFFIFNFDRTFEQQSQFFNPQFWQIQQRILGSAKGRGTTYFLATQDWFGVNCALRHYYRGGLLGKFNKDRYAFSSLSQTRSFAEFHLLQQLYEAGLPVPKPIGARVQKGRLGICYQADILTEKIEHAQDLTALLQQRPLADESWQQIGGLIRRLHDLQICHTDLNAHNILVRNLGEEQKCWLLDFDKCGEKSGDFWKTENLNRLHRSFMKEKEKMNILFTEQNWAELILGYHQNVNNKDKA